MAKRNWKRAVPRSLRHSFELCLEYGKERKNLSVERVADLMGLANHWTLYKWMESGRFPACLIRPFEYVCGVTFVTQNIATSAHKLLIDMPSSKPISELDILELQSSVNGVINVLIKQHQGHAEIRFAIIELSRVMQELAGHRARLELADSPELDLLGDA